MAGRERPPSDLQRAMARARRQRTWFSVKLMLWSFSGGLILTSWVYYYFGYTPAPPLVALTHWREADSPTRSGQAQISPRSPPVNNNDDDHHLQPNQQPPAEFLQAGFIHSEDPSLHHAMNEFLGRPLHQSSVMTSSAQTHPDDDDAATSSSSSSLEQQRVNPSMYGWTPEMYPNPWEEPTRCGIAYLDLDTNVSASSYLRLCDPDWVLGGIFLERIAWALYNFTLTFGGGLTAVNNDNIDQPTRHSSWEVEIGPSRPQVLRRRRMWLPLSSSSPGATNTASATITPNSAISSSIPLAQNLPRVELAVATVHKMNLPNVLRQGSYYAYEDEDDMVNDAAQIFARTLHDAWWAGTCCDEASPDAAVDAEASANCRRCFRRGDNAVLIFLSVQDRVCFISTGSAVSSILPWWRLDHVVSSMKPDLRRRDYGDALLQAIEDLSDMLSAGPPTVWDRLHDFVARFGVVLVFAVCTFVFGAWGEYRDRRKRWQYAEERSRLSSVEREKASQLQQEYRSKCCPICLERFNCGVDDYSSSLGDDPPDEIDEDMACSEYPPLSEVEEDEPKTRASQDEDDVLKVTPSSSSNHIGRAIRRVDSFGIPLRGADGKKIKLLRCGHIFCDTCWCSWVHSGVGNPCICPVCRQDIGKASKKRTSSSSSTSTITSATTTSTSRGLGSLSWSGGATARLGHHHENSQQQEDTQPLLGNASRTAYHSFGLASVPVTLVGGTGLLTPARPSLSETAPLLATAPEEACRA